MIIEVILHSEKYLDSETNEENWENPIILDWSYPVLPRVGENFHVNSLIGYDKDYYTNLSWTVEGVRWHKDRRENIVVTLVLIGY